jgi:hypothetical protein
VTLPLSPINTTQSDRKNLDVWVHDHSVMSSARSSVCMNRSTTCKKTMWPFVMPRPLTGGSLRRVGAWSGPSEFIAAKSALGIDYRVDFLSKPKSTSASERFTSPTTHPLHSTPSSVLHRKLESEGSNKGLDKCQSRRAVFAEFLELESGGWCKVKSAFLCASSKLP